MSLDEVRYMAVDILAALTAMHQNDIVHSDVKPANIFRKWNERIGRYSYYLIDFGFSFESGTITDGWGCSIEYASVEVLKGNPPVRCTTQKYFGEVNFFLSHRRLKMIC